MAEVVQQIGKKVLLLVQDNRIAVAIKKIASRETETPRPLPGNVIKFVPSADARLSLLELQANRDLEYARLFWLSGEHDSALSLFFAAHGKFMELEGKHLSAGNSFQAKLAEEKYFLCERDAGLVRLAIERRALMRNE